MQNSNINQHPNIGRPPSESKKTKLSFYLRKEEALALRNYAIRIDKPISLIVRELLQALPL